MSLRKPTPRPAKQMDGYTPKPRTFALACLPTPQMVTPIPKGEQHKPGKRPATVAEQVWMDAIVALNCIACRMDGHYGTPAEVHHILRGGVRMGHLYTLPLCPPHHRLGGHVIARHPDKAQFERRYGSEIELLTEVQKLVGPRALSAPTPRNPAVTPQSTGAQSGAINQGRSA